MLLTTPNNSLQAGTQLFIDSTQPLKTSRVMLNSGVIPANELEIDQQQYYRNGFIPKNDWRAATLAEEKTLFLDKQHWKREAWNSGSSIGIVHLPDSAIKPLVEILDQSRKRITVLPEEYKMAIQFLRTNSVSLLNNLNLYCLSNSQVEIVGIHSASPGLRTITCNDPNTESRQYIGLHLDSWARAPLRRRHQSQNRLCINLGIEDRHFLFINLTMMDMFRALGLSDPKDIYQHYRAVNLGNAFMMKYPNYPVIRLTVAPQEAYIAPTENIIHDATSDGKKYSDITLHMMGRFGINKA